MAKSDAAAAAAATPEGAAPEKKEGTGKRKKTFKKRGEKRVVHHGLAHIADRIDRNFVRVLTGDRVRVELMPADVGRGRIVGKI